jgi:hypothetical protein
MLHSQPEVPGQNRASVLRDLQMIPGVGPSISWDLWELGYRTVQDLHDQDPQEMYEAHCMLQGEEVDRCVLYVFCCAVYFASHETHDPELLRWWNWKDRAAATG